MKDSVNHRNGGGLVGQEVTPLVEGPMARDAETAPFVGGCDETEEELAAGRVERRKTELVEDDQVDPEQVVDDATDGVVSQTAVQRLDQIGGGEIADAQTGVRGCMANTDEEMRFAGTGGTDQAEILFGADPFQAGDVVVS